MFIGRQPIGIFVDRAVPSAEHIVVDDIDLIHLDDVNNGCTATR